MPPTTAHVAVRFDELQQEHQQINQALDELRDRSKAFTAMRAELRAAILAVVLELAGYLVAVLKLKAGKPTKAKV